MTFRFDHFLRKWIHFIESDQIMPSGCKFRFQC
uniref:Uncharacterized protein n=1 Tax=Ascaris lumbricoides TaxID=6252 RepID=A0A0M3HK29_ASCLU